MRLSEENNIYKVIINVRNISWSLNFLKKLLQIKYKQLYLWETFGWPDDS